MLKELRVKGDERKKVIDALLGRGIQKMDQLAAMDCLADRIFSSLWDNIESTEHGTVFKSLKNGRNLPGTGIIRLQYADRPSLQGADEEMDLEHEAGNSPFIRQITPCYDGAGGGSARANQGANSDLRTSDVDEFGSSPPVQSLETGSIIDLSNDDSSTTASLDENAQTTNMTPGTSRSNTRSVEVLNSRLKRSRKRPRKEKRRNGPGAVMLGTSSQTQGDSGSQHRAPTSILASIHEVLNETSPDSAPLDPGDALRPASAIPFLASQQANPVNASYHSMEGVAQIDPVNAVYPTMGGNFQVNPVNANYPSMEGVAQIDPANAVYPPTGGNFQVDAVNLEYPAMSDVAQIEPVVGLYLQDREQPLNVGCGRVSLIYT